uniref:Protein tyrosine phosphatase 4A1 n=1 Tax=Dicentrarchus labrax TaxID=13489 RepID=A0A8P4G739_DICLA
MNRPAPVEITYKNMRFLITHNPTNATLNKFIEELKKYGVTTVVRVCEATYDAALVMKEGIQVLVIVGCLCQLLVKNSVSSFSNVRICCFSLFSMIINRVYLVYGLCIGLQETVM